MAVLGAVASCTERPSTEPGPPLAPLPQPASPANVLAAIEQLYEKSEMDPVERARAFASLLASPADTILPSFVLRYGFCDIECPWRAWEYDEEVEAHRRMFQATRSMALDMASGVESDYGTIEPDRRGWRVIFVEKATIRATNRAGAVEEIRAAQQLFVFAPAHGRWYLVKWDEHVSQNTMWATFRADFLE